MAIAAALAVSANDDGPMSRGALISLNIIGKDLKGGCAKWQSSDVPEIENDVGQSGFKCKFDGATETCVNLDATKNVMAKVYGKWCGPPSELQRYQQKGDVTSSATDFLHLQVNNGYMDCALSGNIDNVVNTLLGWGYWCSTTQSNHVTCISYTGSYELLRDLKVMFQCLLGSSGPFPNATKYTVLTIKGGQNSEFTALCLAANQDDNGSADKAINALKQAGFTKAALSDPNRITFTSSDISSMDQLLDVVDHLPCYHQPSGFP